MVYVKGSKLSCHQLILMAFDPSVVSFRFIGLFKIKSTQHQIVTVASLDPFYQILSIIYITIVMCFKEY